MRELLGRGDVVVKGVEGRWREGLIGCREDSIKKNRKKNKVLIGGYFV